VRGLYAAAAAVVGALVTRPAEGVPPDPGAWFTIMAALAPTTAEREFLSRGGRAGR
jgi:hypothetical protein